MKFYVHGILNNEKRKRMPCIDCRNIFSSANVKNNLICAKAVIANTPGLWQSMHDKTGYKAPLPPTPTSLGCACTNSHCGRCKVNLSASESVESNWAR